MTAPTHVVRHPATPSIATRAPRPAHRGRGLRRLGALVGVTVLSLSATATTTLAFGPTVSCGARSEAKVFAPWGDQANYFRMPNGGFEAGSTEWRLANGSTVVSGNEPWKVGGSTDSKSLKIPAGGTAESRTICVSRGEDIIRLFASNARVPGSILHVDAIVRNPDTGQLGYAAFDVNGDAAPAGWSPTIQLPIPNLLGGSGTQELTLYFSTRGTAATWYIDDVYVDPYKSY